MHIKETAEERVRSRTEVGARRDGGGWGVGDKSWRRWLFCGGEGPGPRSRRELHGRKVLARGHQATLFCTSLARFHTTSIVLSTNSHWSLEASGITRGPVRNLERPLTA